CARDRGSFDVW
nr:immunoglobulin heavy chain junction region [Macaca mulatta]